MLSGRHKVLVLVAVALWVLVLSAAKILAAHHALYTSDLYDFHQALRSTAAGHFFLSYVYGNVLGDHGYLLLMAFIPLYTVLGDAAFWGLVVVAPVVTGVAAAIVFKMLAGHRERRAALTITVMLVFPGVAWLTFEPLYGFHPDTLRTPSLSSWPSPSDGAVNLRARP